MTKLLARLLLCCSLAFTAGSSFATSTELSRSLTPKISVSGQMDETKFKQLLQQGFKSVIVNRPDQEAGNIVTAGKLRELAEASHISLIYQPVVSGQMTDADAQEFAKYYNSLPKPILLVCKSGNRSALLFNQAKTLGLLND